MTSMTLIRRDQQRERTQARYSDFDRWWISVAQVLRDRQQPEMQFGEAWQAFKRYRDGDVKI